MKPTKKNRENDKKPQENNFLPDEIQELDDLLLERVSGAGNPFEDRPRPGYQPIDDDLRGNG